MSKWFRDVFLVSLFDRYGHKETWLTRKQTAVCTEHMEIHTVSMDEYPGDNRKKIYYTTEWNGRDVILNYSKKNGCGTIQFGATEEERRQAKETHECERLERLLKRNPDRFMTELNQAYRRLEYWKDELRLDIEDGLEDVAAEDRRYIQTEESYIRKMERMLA